MRGAILKPNRVRLLVSATCLLAASGCAIDYPEASLPADEPLALATGRVEAAAGLRFRAEPVRAWLAPEQAGELERASRLHAGQDRLIDETCFQLFRGPSGELPAAAAARPAAATAAYDPAGGRVIVVEGAAPGRDLDLARTEALALALLDQHLDFEKSLERLADQADRFRGLHGLAWGAAHASTLEASLAPIYMYDASASALHRLHARLTQRLLLDPDGAPAELLAEVALPAAERRALERLLGTSGLERRRAILGLFCGARLVIEAKDRMTAGNLRLVYEDPPRSSEHLLHPERYLDQGDPPLSIEAGARHGLIGPGFTVLRSEAAGEFGLLNALEGALLPGDAASAAEGWGGDLLTVFRGRESGELALAWRIEFDDRLEAMQACSALERAAVLRFGGRFEEGMEGIWFLAEGTRNVSYRREGPSLALVIASAPADIHRAAVLRLLQEPARAPDKLAREARQDRGFRLVRLLASPIFFDEPGRFDSLFEGFFGVLFRHRAYPSGAEHEFLNLSEFPLLGRFIPEEFSRILFGVERSPYRRDTAFLANLVRMFRNEESGSSRFSSPFLSLRSGREFESLAVLYGFLWEQAAGAGRKEASPRLFFSHWTGLDGAERETGILLDVVSWRRRDGIDSRLRLLPYGALAEITSSTRPDGVDLGMFLGGIRVRSQTVLPEMSHFDFSMLGGYLLRLFRDQASGNYEWSLLSGLIAGVEGGTRYSSGGVIRILGHSLIGGGQEEGTRFVDLFFVRIRQ
ncbi:MAG: hypothetical protein HY812_02415 [Planctomycetes bacterium]|nr:hypothetical protein [Planctomycetota bacterium]